MNKKHVLFASLFGLLVAGQSSAHDNEFNISATFSQCMDRTGGTTFGMKECIASEEKKQDTRLNKAYSAVMKTLSPSRQGQLKEAQRAWLKFRDTDCSFLHDPEGGTLAGVISADCYMRKAAQRATELEALAN